MRHRAVQLAVAHAVHHMVFAPEHDRVVRVARAQQVAGEVELCVGEPLRAGHLVAIDQHALAALADHPTTAAVALPHAHPELLRVRYRPVVQRVVVGQRDAPALRSRKAEGGDVGAGDTLGRGHPQGLVFMQIHDVSSPSIETSGWFSGRARPGAIPGDADLAASAQRRRLSRTAHAPHRESVPTCPCGCPSTPSSPSLRNRRDPRPRRRVRTRSSRSSAPARRRTS